MVLETIMDRLQSWKATYDDIMVNRRDPRTDGWFLMSSPIPTLSICLAYVIIVKLIGPKFMKHRKPYNLRLILVVYNFAQMVFSIWLFRKILFAGWIQKYSLRCQPVDYSNDPLAVSMVYAAWWYYFSKFTEFFDTFFFVLRKKYEHVSALHVVHHGVMPMSVWFGVKFTPGGHSTFFGLLNTFVHIVMYFYYMLAAVGPSVHKYLWWKKYLTALQMVQFIGIFVHAFQLLFIDCDYPRAFVWWIGGHAVLFFFLFFDFWKKAYRKQANDRKKKDSGSLKNGVTNGTANGHYSTRRRVANGDSKGHQHH
ncbi:unnamed protein product [Cyprideis torosa]|uniref:Elongation of very long chain fatty acids protein n=1 Tax=Cyprideis torosa TaxID=163714 RepID=A0A7R8ZUC4_9CRUS|nr:unnamed protein product [Cyprideis torosa]CAG0900249.1 unnamed protein product [Cyprideis torosa]